MLQPYLDRMVSKLATDCMAQRAQRFFYKDWYAQNYNYCCLLSALSLLLSYTYGSMYEQQRNPAS